MEVRTDKEADRVFVNIDGSLTAEELRELLAKLAKAHGELTGVRAIDTGTPLFEATNADIRPKGSHVQFSLLTLFGWCQFEATSAQAHVLDGLLGEAVGRIKVTGPLN
jgi:hypothetical protein